MLDVLEVGDAAPGGTLVVLLHGWGDSADGILPLAELLVAPGIRLLVPDGPLPHYFGGRAWWELETDSDPAWAWTESASTPHEGVTAARSAVQQLISDARKRHTPESVVVVGFSQGAMLALDVGLHPESEVDAVAALSGALLADSARWLDRKPRSRFLLIHGESDDVVPLAGGVMARDRLQENGFDVKWLAFPGGHDVPAEILAPLRHFITPR